jgi:dephospho-CoA kinase
MLKVGLTGGIGSGKSAAAACFRARGITVVDTDEIAHQMLEPGQAAYDEVITTFGAHIVDAQGRIDRARLRQRVFSRPAERRQLEAILHPRIREAMLQQTANAPGPYVVLMIPLLVETGQQDLVDRVLVITASERQRLQWLQVRDEQDVAQIRAIMAAQVSDRERLAVADDRIDNSGSLQQLDQQVERLHQRYLSLAGAQG